MKYVIDCEFDGFNGPLLSMALVGKDGTSFYEVIEFNEINDPWVAVNVVPILNKVPVPYTRFQNKLYSFLMSGMMEDGEHTHTIYADWPDDIKYFCQSLITGPGTMLPIPGDGFSTVVIRGLDIQPLIPHNALSDAKAIMRTLKLRNII